METHLEVISGDIQSFISESVDKYRLAKIKKGDERNALKRARREVRRSIAAQNIIQIIAQNVQETAHKQIATIVSRCLKTVFGEDCYEFKIKFERKRGQTEAEMVFVKDGQEYNPVDSCGGGVIDVAAFALRLACLMLQRPKKRRVLILDEPFKFLSERKEYRERVKELLEALADEMNVQFITVTHAKELELGKVIELH